MQLHASAMWKECRYMVLRTVPIFLDEGCGVLGDGAAM